jgi:subfamily B ATP-binding cassette protein MsbA
LTLCAFLVLPTTLLPLFILGKKARRATVANLSANIKQTSQLVELIGSIRVVKAFGLELAQLSRFRITSEQMVHSGMKGVQAKELLNPIIEIIGVFGLGALMLYIFMTGTGGSGPFWPMPPSFRSLKSWRRSILLSRPASPSCA